jgi:hypothetical protein
LKTVNLFDQKEQETIYMDSTKNMDKKFNELVVYYSQKIKNKSLDEVDEPSTR